MEHPAPQHCWKKRVRKKGFCASNAARHRPHGNACAGESQLTEGRVAPGCSGCRKSQRKVLSYQQHESLHLLQGVVGAAKAIAV
eukprot:782065-Pelagomonas_calceolata.AAC.5